VIPNGFSVKAGSTEFTTYYTTTIVVTNNSQVTITVQEENRRYTLPVTISGSNFLFVLPFRQVYIPTPQEFEIPEDLQQYQFYSIDVPFDGQYSEVTVEVRPPDSATYEEYSKVDSLFLMTETTKGYVLKRTDEGINLQFGNGLIGYQPEPGATVRVSLKITEGSDGNVIAGSITSGDTIYTSSGGTPQVVQYTITNTSAAFGGSDEESVEEIRRNAISSITALNRIVTENDFINTDTIIENSPIGQNSLPVLKRSDLKINEICLFSTLFFGNELVPTRNIYSTFSDTVVRRQTVLTEASTEYYTVFDMEIDLVNSSASYTYVLSEIEKVPSLVTTFNSTYDLYANTLVVTTSGDQVTFKLYYQSTEPDYSITLCDMKISETGATYAMTNDGTSFSLTFSDYRTIPKGNLTYYFTISHPTSGNIAQYLTQFILRLPLSDFTTSNVVVNDSTSYTVYDIPVVKKSYYDSITQKDFELQVLQQLLTTLTFKNYKMLTDFINFKFANTTGQLSNMQLNETTVDSVKDILLTPPTLPSNNDRYIVARNAVGAWKNHDDEIATASISDSTSVIWTFYEPKTEEIAYVESKAKKYTYAETGWVVPVYTIPINISLDVFISSSYSGTLSELTDTIRSDLVSAFEDRFGINTNIYKSEIIDVVQEVNGVEHCRIVEPESSIFFDYDIDNFTQEELLQYTPEYVYFTEDNISIRVFNLT